MKVKVTALGFDGMRRVYPGDIMELKDIKTMVTLGEGEMVEKIIKAEDQFSSKWMSKLVEAKQEVFELEDDVHAEMKKSRKKQVRNDGGSASDQDVL